MACSLHYIICAAHDEPLDQIFINLIPIRYQMNIFPVGANLVFAQGRGENIKVCPLHFNNCLKCFDFLLFTGY